MERKERKRKERKTRVIRTGVPGGVSHESTKHIPFSPVPLRTGIVFRTSSTAVQLFKWLVASRTRCVSTFVRVVARVQPGPDGYISYGCLTENMFFMAPAPFRPENASARRESSAHSRQSAHFAHSASPQLSGGGRHFGRIAARPWGVGRPARAGTMAISEGSNAISTPPEAVSRGVDMGDPKVALRPLPTQPPRGWYVHSPCWYGQCWTRRARAQRFVCEARHSLR